MSALTKTRTVSCTLVIAFFFACQSYEPITPPRLQEPVFTGVGLTEAKLSSYREAIRVQWSPPSEDSVDIRSFTLIRKIPGDSMFDVFFHSQEIPDSFTAFNDDATPIGFPTDGYTLVQYKIFALDTFGRPSDTSEACSLYLAPQPVLDRVDTTTWCFFWISRRIQGSVSSFIKLWNNTATVSWESVPYEDFGSADYPLNFKACLPDSMKPLPSGTWRCALFLDAMGTEHQSMKVDSFNVP